MGETLARRLYQVEGDNLQFRRLQLFSRFGE